jgi:hypothetical protein
MTINLRDPRVLVVATPDLFQNYLNAQGWFQVASLEGKGTSWIFNAEDDQYSVFLPESEAVGDYPLCAANILSTLAEVERQPMSDIYAQVIGHREASTSTDDIVRLRAMHPESTDGSIPIRDAAKLYSGAYRMVEAAAAVVETKRAYLPTRKSEAVRTYLDQTRVGQSERGSYVVVVHSPLHDVTTNSDTLEIPDVSFGRQVLTTLTEALTSLKQIAERVDPDLAGERELDHYADQFVASGGSAELCEAVERLHESVQDQQIELRFNWSQTVPVQPTLPHTIALNASVRPVTERLQRTLRRRLMQEEMTLRGRIIRFNDKSANDRDLGITTVTIRAFVHNKQQHIRITLRNENDRTLCVRALYERKILVCTGQYHEYGNYNTLENYRELKIEGEE